MTRAEIEDVRGVDAGATVKSLLERHLIRIAGQREVPGRPMLYGTTRRFLEVFGLERLKDLPTLRELDELAREQGLIQRTSESADIVAEAAERAKENAKPPTRSTRRRKRSAPSRTTACWTEPNRRTPRANRARRSMSPVRRVRKRPTRMTKSSRAPSRKKRTQPLTSPVEMTTADASVDSDALDADGPDISDERHTGRSRVT